jgi:hypothetical protein
MFAAAMLVASGALILPQTTGQVTPDPLKHLTTARIDGARGGARLSAVNIERDVPYPSTVHMKGSVLKSGSPDSRCALMRPTITKKPARSMHIAM